MILAALLAPSSAAAKGWTGIQLPGTAAKVFLLGVSCPTKSFCVAVGTNNLIASSTNPTGGPGAWDVVYAGEGPWPDTNDWPAPFISGHQIQSVSCPTVSLCVAVTDFGDIYTSTNPTGPGSSWQVTEIGENGPNTHLYGVSCPTAGLCVAVTGKRSDQGKVLTTTNPSGGSAAWQAVEFGQSFEFKGVSCPTPSLCVAVANDGRIVTSTDPTGEAGAWQTVGAPGGPGSLRAVSCVAAPLCLSGNVAGNLLTSTNPGGGEAAWKEFNGGGNVQITGASCASAGECVAVDNNGDVLSSTDPLGGAGAWSLQHIVPYQEGEGPTDYDGKNALFAASCTSNDFCAAVGTLGQIFTSTTPLAAAKTPSSPAKRKRKPRRPQAKISNLHLPFLHHGDRRRGTVMIRFYARGGIRGFRCRIDKRAFRPCHSPRRYSLGIGRHVFRVRAVGLTGLSGPAAREEFFLGPHCTHGKVGPKFCSEGATPTR